MGLRALLITAWVLLIAPFQMEHMLPKGSLTLIAFLHPRSRPMGMSHEAPSSSRGLLWVLLSSSGPDWFTHSLYPASSHLRTTQTVFEFPKSQPRERDKVWPSQPQGQLGDTRGKGIPLKMPNWKAETTKEDHSISTYKGWAGGRGSGIQCHIDL